MEFLPIDYYILLQEGFEKTIEPEKTNYVFYSNMPLLVKKRSYLKQSTEIIKNVTYEDVMKCLDKNEAESILLDPLAKDEVHTHIEKNFGKIQEIFFINYKTANILSRFHVNGKPVGTDQIEEFEQTLL